MSLPLYAQPAKVFRGDLGDGVHCWVPTALFADAGGTLPHQALKAPVVDANGPRLSVSQRGARLATVMLAWNVFQHFYPYFDVVGTDWNKELETALRAAALDANEGAFYRTLNRLVVQLHDDHASLAGPGLPLPMPLEARVELVEGQVVVTGVPPTAGLKAGDVVERIEGRSAREVFNEIASYVSAATPQWRDWKAAQQFGPLPPTNPATLEVRGADGAARMVRVACSRSKADDAIRRLPKLHEIKPGVFYVDVTRLTRAEFEAALPDLAKARGLVFEMRGYPSLEPAMWLGHLSPAVLRSPLWNVPRTHRPDRTDVEWDIGSCWTLEARQPQLTANRVFLADGSAISAAETVLGIVEAYRLGPVVGGSSAGTNGEITATDLPLGYRVWWTGMKVLKHDGSRHHGVGIAATVPVAKTLQGIRDGRDEQFERALSLLK